MTDMTPRQHGRTAMYHLERAVVAVLLKAKSRGEFVGPAFVSQQTGIHRGDQHNDNIVHAVFHKLLTEKRVERGAQIDGRPGWALTNAEYKRLRP